MASLGRSSTPSVTATAIGTSASHIASRSSPRNAALDDPSRTKLDGIIHVSEAKGEERVTLVELRRYERTPVDIEVEFERKGSSDRRVGRASDISLGGMFVRTPAPPGFSTEIVVYMRVRGQRAPLAIPGVVRWTRGDGMGIQFGLLGARETHAITELAKR
jgi:type IV pilus assembly protein PilZ